ncbi:class I SAM-dependent methyltransferase [Zongyangia hominis]|uniref:Class I SAM-dependent methyltransferase n=1 Tax=Zongyangia hominis TaxID=2763677 RepID=A0A926IAM2_9FIRM|nr:class I SAM-dependent methyltransferase [Zongyangia hominis]MBC8570361.1 class I SAM-dependent methyltransferase [Zongyangia hominis]
MESILESAKHLIRPSIRPDSTVADFTMGNGNDTLFLAGLVPQGKVYAFDIQPQALENTRALLEREGMAARADLILDSHHRADQYIPGEIDAGMFNLGYLPYGDHKVTTQLATTLEAVERALALLSKGGCLLIVVYPGHPEGQREGESLTQWAAGLDKKRYDALLHRLINVPECPFILALWRRK